MSVRADRGGAAVRAAELGDEGEARRLFSYHASPDGVISAAHIKGLIAGQLERSGADANSLDGLFDALLKMMNIDEGGFVDIAQFTSIYRDQKTELDLLFQPPPEDWQQPVAPESGDEGGAAAHSGDRSADIPPRKLAALKSLFDAADENQAGFISASALHQVLQDEDLGGQFAVDLRSNLVNLSGRFIAEMFVKLDRNGDGKFDFDEFCAAFAPALDDAGIFCPVQGIHGAQLHALALCYAELQDELQNLRQLFTEQESQWKHRLTLMHDEMESRDENSQAHIESLAESDAEIARLKREKVGLQQQVAVLDARCSDLEHKVTEANTERSSAQEQYRSCRSESQKLKEEVKELKFILSKYEGQNDDQSENYINHSKPCILQENLDTLTAKLSSTQIELEDAQNKYMNLSSHIFRLMHGLEELLQSVHSQTTDGRADSNTCRTIVKSILESLQSSPLNVTTKSKSEHRQEDPLVPGQEMAKHSDLGPDLVQAFTQFDEIDERRQKEIKELRGRLAASEAARQARAAQVQEIQSKVIALQKKISYNDQQERENSISSAEYIAKIRKLEKELAEFKAQGNASNSEEIRQSRRRARTLEKRASAAEAERDALKRQIRERGSSLSRISMSASAVPETTDRITKAISNATNENSKVEIRSPRTNGERFLAIMQIATIVFVAFIILHHPMFNLFPPLLSKLNV